MTAWRRRCEGALILATIQALAHTLHHGGLAVTLMLIAGTLGSAWVLVFLGWAWGRDTERERQRIGARR